VVAAAAAGVAEVERLLLLLLLLLRTPPGQDISPQSWDPEWSVHQVYRLLE